MQWLVDIDKAVADGLLPGDSAAALKRRARDLMVDYAINLLFFGGVVMMIAGTAYWLRHDRAALAGLGLTVAIIAVIWLVTGSERLRPAANAAAIIGLSLVTYVVADLLFDGRSQLIAVGALVGFPLMIAGWAARRRWPDRLAIFGGWMFLLGAVVHASGILLTDSHSGLQWLALVYIGLLAIACGVVLDIRLVTGAAIIPLAAALSSRAWYEHASYTVAIYEVTLTVIEMIAICGASFAIAKRYPGLFAQHARILGHLALIWMNVAFWIGSLWGDVVGLYLWGPRWTNETTYTAWHAAIDAFKAHTLVVSADVYAAIWAIVIAVVGAWAALSGRRGILNICVTFGAVDFYTQYFERLETTPLAIAVAGFVAIAGAIVLRWLNATMTGHRKSGYLARGGAS